MNPYLPIDNQDIDDDPDVFIDEDGAPVVEVDEDDYDDFNER